MSWLHWSRSSEPEENDEGKASPQQDAETEYFPLRARNGVQVLLHEDQTLIITPLHEMALLIDWREKRLVAACTFFDQELALLLPILRAWPRCVSYARLLCYLESADDPTDAAVAEQEQRVTTAIQAGRLDDLLAPLRSRLADTQRKLQIFGIKLVSLLETGVVCVPGAVGAGRRG